MDSKINNERYCFVCGTVNNLHKHHIFGGANRQNSEADGLWVYLCAKHHNMSDEGVHFNQALDKGLKKLGQRTYEQEHGHEAYMMRYGRNYI